MQEELKTAKRDGCLPKFGRPVPQFSNMVSLLEKMLAGEERELVELQKGKLKEVRAKGIGPMMERYKPGHWDPENAEVALTTAPHLERAWAFGVLSLPCPVVTLSSKPDGGLTTVCLPFIYLPDAGDGRRDAEPMIEALGVLVWLVAREACPGKATWGAAKLVRTPHKAEWKGDKDGMLWFNKACESTRIATTIVDSAMKMGKKKRWYAYLGGGGGGQRPELAHAGPRHPCEGLGVGCLHPRRALAAVGVQRLRQASLGGQTLGHRGRRGH